MRLRTLWVAPEVRRRPLSTCVSPLALLARLDRYLDWLEMQTGRKVNRGMITRRALELFLETHESGATR
jgi:hypothetical protein